MRAGPMKRSPLRRSNPRRRRAAHARDFGERAAIIRTMPCLAAADGRCLGRIEAAHARSRGAGGDRHHLVPLCTGHHREQHDHGVQTFARKHGLDLLTHAHRIAAELDAQGVP